MPLGLNAIRKEPALGELGRAARVAPSSAAGPEPGGSHRRCGSYRTALWAEARSSTKAARAAGSMRASSFSGMMHQLTASALAMHDRALAAPATLATPG